MEPKRWRYLRRNRVIFKGEYGDQLRLLISLENELGLAIYSSRKSCIELEFQVRFWRRPRMREAGGGEKRSSIRAARTGAESGGVLCVCVLVVL